MYYALVALSIPGAVLLRRRHVPITPLVAVGLTVVVSVTIDLRDDQIPEPV